VDSLEGRALGHGEEESTGPPYMILEGTDHKIHFIYRSADLDAARRQGKLSGNSFVRLKRLIIDQQFQIKVQYFGDAEQLLSNKHHFNTVAQHLLDRDVMPREIGMAGWLGRYDNQLTAAARELAIENAKREARKSYPGPILER
jgi:hypothetical protein